MLLSMTGFGEANRQTEGLAVMIEVRTVNNRHFKLNMKCPDGYGSLESQIETLARERIKRGTVQLSIRVSRARKADDYKLNATALASYREQLESLNVRWHMCDKVNLENLLVLPGVVDERSETLDIADDWTKIAPALETAFDHLHQMRIEEGRKMAEDLASQCATITKELNHIQVRAPQVVDGYRARLEERLKTLLAEYQVTLNPGDLIREVSIYSERSNISEEVVRLRSHIEQFESMLAAKESAGRKLDFLTQEMFREANTIGSKSNDVQLARHVVEIKSAIDMMREMVQNVE